MDKFDLIQADIRRQELALEELKDDFLRAKNKLQEEFNALVERRNQFSYLYDEFADISHHFSRQGDIDEEAHYHFRTLLENYIEETEFEFQKESSLIEEKDNDLMTTFQKSRREMEDKLEESYDLLRKVDIEMEEERRRINHEYNSRR